MTKLEKQAKQTELFHHPPVYCSRLLREVHTYQEGALVVDYLKVYVVIVVESLYKLFGLVFVLKKPDGYVAVSIVVYQTKGSSSGNIA